MSHHLPKGRRGAAFLFLIVLVLLVIVGTTRTFVMGSIAQKRHAASQQQMEMLMRAIDQSADLLRAENSIRLPVDVGLDQWIELTVASELLTAKLKHGTQIINQVSRPIDSESK